MDYSNAFNSIDRPQLINDLQSSGVQPSVSRWISGYFSDRRQYTSVNGRKSSLIPVRRGVLQGAILSPFCLSTYIAGLPQYPATFTLKYADDVAVGCAITKSCTSNTLSASLQSITDWSRARKLKLNPSKCVKLVFSTFRGARRTALSSTLPSTLLCGEEMTSRSNFKYLGVTLADNFSWAPHLHDTLFKTRRLAHYAYRLRAMGVQKTVISTFVFSCIVPQVLYCSPAIFPSFLSKYFAILRRCIKTVSRAGQLRYEDLANFIVDKHFSACQRLIDVIRSDPSHPLQPDILACVSNSVTRNAFKIAPARTSAYRNSFVPYASRYLCFERTVVNELKSSLCV